jgi:hypothetical protein
MELGMVLIPQPLARLQNVINMAPILRLVEIMAAMPKFKVVKQMVLLVEV